MSWEVYFFAEPVLALLGSLIAFAAIFIIVHLTTDDED